MLFVVLILYDVILVIDAVYLLHSYHAYRTLFTRMGFGILFLSLISNRVFKGVSNATGPYRNTVS